MEEKKMTDADIIKALEYCSGVKPACDEHCPAYNLQNEMSCQDYMNRLVLDLIYRWRDGIIEQTNRIERLEMDIMDFPYDKKQAAKDAVKKFTEMLKERKIELGTDGHSCLMVFAEDIDETYEEFVKEE